ncbi:tRNA (guanine-N7-)-methyltransferase [Nematocida sp. AWRm80]|nr:tRNA (guanine-N7-)-methyltransferase [Nematocida sp. AWRm80]
MKHPQKRYFRQRAHCNPFSDHDLEYPLSPEAYPYKATMVDIGCGYGGLLFKLSEMYPEENILGMEIRKKLVEYIKLKIKYLQNSNEGIPPQLEYPSEDDIPKTPPMTEYTHVPFIGTPTTDITTTHTPTPIRTPIQSRPAETNIPNEKHPINTKYRNIEVVRTNSMKFIMNYLQKGSIKKMFILFPDPHFKKKKHKARIISSIMLDIYYYILNPNGYLYIATDVLELFEYMCDTINRHPLFEMLPEEESLKDPLYDVIVQGTEESKKADMKQSNKYRAIFKPKSLSRITNYTI